MSESKARVLSSKKLVTHYQAVFNSNSGKIVLRDLMKVNYITSPTFAEHNDSLTLLREGQRNAILRIMTILKIDPEQFLEQPEEELSHVP